MYKLETQKHHLKYRNVPVAYKAELEKPRERENILLCITSDWFFPTLRCNTFQPLLTRIGKLFPRANKDMPWLVLAQCAPMEGISGLPSSSTSDNPRKTGSAFLLGWEHTENVMLQLCVHKRLPLDFTPTLPLIILNWQKIPYQCNPNAC